MKDLWRACGIVAALVALLIYLLIRSVSPDMPLRRNMQKQLQIFELHDAELTRDAMLTRAGLLPNYDALLRDRANLMTSLHTLRKLSASGTAESKAALGHSLEALSHALNDKLTDVEHFKTDDALLRHSVAYLTYTISRRDEPSDTRLARGAEVRDLSSAFLRFVQTPTASSGAGFKAALEHLANQGEVDDGLRSLIAHGTLVAELLPRGVATLRQIVAAPTTLLANELQAEVEKVAGETAERAQVFRYLLFFVAVVLLAYPMGQFARLRASARDLRRTNDELNRLIGEREKAESALRASEERFRAIAESAHDAIISADSSGAIVSWNPGAEAIYGYRRDEILDTPLARLMPERDRDAAPFFAAVGQGATLAPQLGTTLEATGVRKDGSEFPIEASIGHWSTAQGSFVTAIIRDVGGRKHLEETSRQQELKLVQANKLAALGTLVSGVAHEINNPNQLVLLNSSVLADTWRDACLALDVHREQEGEFTLAGLPYAEMRDAASALIRDLNEGACRIDRIVQDLKDFVRPQRTGPQVNVCVNDIVHRAVRLLAHLINNRTLDFKLKLAQGLPAIRGDAQQVEQVVVNLLVNALEALPGPSGGVAIETRVNAANGCVVVEVSDQGVGIAPEHLQRLCDPFFTTKQDSGGTGLGLAVTLGLIRAHGGRLDFDSEPGCGTRATVSFPPAMPVH